MLSSRNWPVVPSGDPVPGKYPGRAEETWKWSLAPDTGWPSLLGEEDVASVEFKTHQWFSGADSFAALILQF